VRGFPPTNSDDFEESVRSRCVQLDLGRVHREEEDLYCGSGTVDRKVMLSQNRRKRRKTERKGAKQKGRKKALTRKTNLRRSQYDKIERYL